MLPLKLSICRKVGEVAFARIEHFTSEEEMKHLISERATLKL